MRLPIKIHEEVLKALDAQNFGRKQVVIVHKLKLRRRTGYQGESHVSGEGLAGVRERVIVVKLPKSVGGRTLLLQQVGAQFEPARHFGKRALVGIEPCRVKSAHGSENLLAGFDRDSRVVSGFLGASVRHCRRTFGPIRGADYEQTETGQSGIFLNELSDGETPRLFYFSLERGQRSAGCIAPPPLFGAQGIRRSQQTVRTQHKL